MQNKLIYGELEKGNYYVRPIDWAGLWNNGKLVGGNILYEFETEKECISAIKASEISVFRMNDYEWWASKLSLEETEKIYEKEVADDNERIQRCKERCVYKECRDRSWV